MSAWAQENRNRIIEAAKKYELVRLKDRLNSGYGIAPDPRQTQAALLQEEILRSGTPEEVRDWLRENHPDRVLEVETSFKASAEGQSQLMGMFAAQTHSHSEGTP
jgi:hypothetical protein